MNARSIVVICLALLVATSYKGKDILKAVRSAKEAQTQAQTRVAERETLAQRVTQALSSTPVGELPSLHTTVPQVVHLLERRARQHGLAGFAISSPGMPASASYEAIAKPTAIGIRAVTLSLVTTTLAEQPLRDFLTGFEGMPISVESMDVLSGRATINLQVFAQ